MKSLRGTRRNVTFLLVEILLLVTLMVLGSMQAVHAETTITDPSTDQNNPIAVTADTYTYTGDNYSYHYYSYTATEDAIVTINRLGTNATSIYFKTSDDSDYNDRGLSTKATTEVPTLAGKTIMIRAYTGYGGGTYSFSITATPYNWGTITTNISSVKAGTSNQHFTFTLTGAASDVKVQAWSLSGSSSDRGNCSVKNGETGSGDIRTQDAGYSQLTYAVDSDEFGFYSNSHNDGRFTKTITVAPTAVSNVSLSHFTVGYDSATIKSTLVGFGDPGVNGSMLRLQRNVSGTWKTIKEMKTGTKSVTIKGLKAKSTYKYRFVSYVPANGALAELTAPPSKTFTIKTGLKTAPAIKSIKVTGAKTKHIKRVYHPGHWSGNHWFKGYYTGGNNVTSFKVKITLKKKISGTAGLKIDEKYVNGKGKTFTTELSYNGKLKGKNRTIAIASYRDSRYGGTSKGVLKSVKIS